MPACTATAPSWARAASTLPTSANGTSSSAFGRDELVTVRAEPVQDLTGSAGFTGSRVAPHPPRLHRGKTATNPVTLQVLHAAPVAQRKDRGRIGPAHRPGLEPQPRHRGLAAAAGRQGPLHSSAPSTPSVPKTTNASDPSTRPGQPADRSVHNPLPAPATTKPQEPANMSYQHPVAVDGSPTADHAVTECGPGRTSGGRIRLLNVMDPWPTSAVLSGLRSQRQEVLPRLPGRANACKDASAWTKGVPV